MTHPMPEDWAERRAREAADEAALMRRFQDIRDNGWNGEVCTLGSGSTDVIGAGCRNCGHTNMLHPQPFANPALSECVICRLFKTIEEMKTSGGQQ